MRTDDDSNLIGLVEYIVQYFDIDRSPIGDTEYRDEVNLTDFRNTAKSLGATSFIVTQTTIIFDEQV